MRVAAPVVVGGPATPGTAAAKGAASTLEAGERHAAARDAAAGSALRRHTKCAPRDRKVCTDHIQGSGRHSTAGDTCGEKRQKLASPCEWCRSVKLSFSRVRLNKKDRAFLPLSSAELPYTQRIRVLTRPYCSASIQHHTHVYSSDIKKQLATMLL